MFILTTLLGGSRGRPARQALLATCLALIFTGPSAAEKVDAEFILLVDVSDIVMGTEFGALTDGYATAMESSAVIDLFVNKAEHGMAASVVFMGDGGTETVAVPWMKITDAGSAQAFADALRAAPRPALYSTTSVASALDYATERFGSETGFAANGFESTHQAITVTSETEVPVGGSPLDVLAARDNAMAAGVDVIHGITVGTTAQGLAAAYYETFIVSGQVWGLHGSVSNAPDYASLPAAATSNLSHHFMRLLPEPSSSILLAMATAILGLRRRR